MKPNGGFEVEGDGRIHQLLFANVRWCFESQIGDRSPTDLSILKELDDKCQIYVELLKHASQVKVIPGAGDFQVETLPKGCLYFCTSCGSDTRIKNHCLCSIEDEYVTVDKC